MYHRLHMIKDSNSQYKHPQRYVWNISDRSDSFLLLGQRLLLAAEAGIWSLTVEWKNMFLTALLQWGLQYQSGRSHSVLSGGVS